MQRRGMWLVMAIGICQLAAGAQPRLFVQTGHPVGSMSFSPDGRLLLTGSTSFGQDNMARLWDVASAREIGRFVGHRGFVWDVAFAPDGRRVFTASFDGTARLWDIASGQELRRFAGHHADIQALACSLDGRRLVTASRDMTARVWDVETGRETACLRGHTEGLTDVAISADGRRVVTGSRDQTARVWDVVTGAELLRLVGHQGDVTSVAFSPDGRSVLTGGRSADYRAVHTEDHTARIWDSVSGQERLRCETPGVVLSVAWGPAGPRALVVWVQDRTKQVYALMDVLGQREVRRIGPDAPEVPHLSSDGVWLWGTRSDTNTFSVRQVDDAQPPVVFEGSGGRVEAVAFAPRSAAVLVASMPSVSGRGQLNLWDGLSGRVKWTSPHVAAGAAPVFSPDGQWVVGGNGKEVLVLQSDTGRAISRLAGSAHSFTGLAISPNGQQVLGAALDKTVRLWDLATRQEVRRFEGRADYTRSVAISPDGKQVLTAGDDNTARMYEVATGRETRRWSSDAFRASWSSDGRYVLTDGLQILSLWAAGDGAPGAKPLSQTNGLYAMGTAFDPSGKMLAVAGRSGIHLLELPTLRQIRTFGGQIGTASSVAFSHDGKLLLSNSSDGTARLWDTATGGDLCMLLTLSNGSWVVVTPDGRFDTNNLDDLTGLHWVMPDAPFAALPAEVFMRQYYEPRLLARLLQGQKLPPVPSLMDLNRVQPIVRITSVTPTGPNTISVTVSAEGASADYERQGRTVHMSTAAHDLRLFRDGQLVGAVDGVLRPGARASFTVRLPRLAQSKTIKMSAYCFNDDQVKSTTARETYVCPPAADPVPGRAYVVSIGVDGYEHPDWPALHYAARDATVLQQTLVGRLRATGRYREVRGVCLLSPRQGPAQVTKATVKAVLDSLAGRQADQTALAVAGVGPLPPASPEDVVLLTWSGHGYAGQNGQFYLLPTDLGATGDGTSAATLARAVSSDELSVWLRAVDAGQLGLVIDACESGASVDGDGFKPGPMGSRGLGQLAYDKGMAVLTSSQADQSAAESAALRHGLLIYALVAEGIEERRAARDGVITLASWLGYGSERVPVLCRELRAGTWKASNLRGAPTLASVPRAESLQQPALFDFGQTSANVVLAQDIQAPN